MQEAWVGPVECSKVGRLRGRVVSTPDFESKVPGSIPVMTINWICNAVIPSFNSSTTLLNSQLVSLPPAGILNKFPLDLRRLFMYSQYSQ